VPDLSLARARARVIGEIGDGGRGGDAQKSAAWISREMKAPGARQLARISWLREGGAGSGGREGYQFSMGRFNGNCRSTESEGNLSSQMRFDADASCARSVRL